MSSINTKSSLRNTLFTGYASIALLVGVFGAWAALSDINGAVIASATIVAESYSKRVQHPDGGIVSRILVKDGDRVTEGQALVMLDPTDAKAELGIIDGSLAELQVKKARLEAQRDGSKKLVINDEVKRQIGEGKLASIFAGQEKLLESTADSLKGKSEQLREQVSQLKEQIAGIEAQLVSKKKQSGLILKELTSLRTLQEKGLVPNSRVLSVEREAARLTGEDGELRASNAEVKIAELQERRVSLSSRLARTSINAPITGTIYQLAVHTEGGVIGSGETLMLIVPEGDDLVLQAQVQPNDIDQVQAGQPAQVRFPGFNARLTPEIFAEVQQVAADTTRVDNSSLPYYAVRLVISAAELKKLGSNKLKPGMTAEAFIQTGARSPLSYLLKPLIDQFSRAFREG
jgi:HlyD family secretion protein